MKSAQEEQKTAKDEEAKAKQEETKAKQEQAKAKEQLQKDQQELQTAKGTAQQAKQDLQKAQEAAEAKKAEEAEKAKIASNGSGDKKDIDQMLDAASKKYGIPPDILKAVAWQESTWNPDAKSFDGQHGKGVMQIDDRYHDFAKTQDAFDPAKNIDYGARYLAGLKDQYGSWQEALHHYNGGSTYAGKIMGLAQSQPWQQYA